MTESLTEILKLRLSANPSVPLDPPATAADKMVRVLLVKAMNGDVEAIREVWDRVEPAIMTDPRFQPMSWDLIPPALEPSA